MPEQTIDKEASSMTNARFAGIVSRIAQTCSSWAGDSLSVLDWCNQPVEPEAAKRFIAEMRGRIDYIERHLS